MWEIDVPSIVNKIRYNACVETIAGKFDSRSGCIVKSFIILAKASSKETKKCFRTQHFY